jgi:acetyltransferase-like isoleucine patch superfamily enzyme
MRRGLKVGKNVYIFQDVEIDPGYPYLIEIGDNCRIGKMFSFLPTTLPLLRTSESHALHRSGSLKASFIGREPSFFRV